MEGLEALQFELESLLYTKSEAELKEFAASVKIDKDLSDLSKIGILKTIQKDLDARISVESEISAKVSWLKEHIAVLKPHDQNQENEQEKQENEIIKLQQEIEALKEKQLIEMSDLMTKLTLVKGNSAEITKPPSEVETPTTGK